MGPNVEVPRRSLPTRRRFGAPEAATKIRVAVREVGRTDFPHRG